MANEQGGPQSIVAAADLSSYVNRAVRLTSTGINLPALAGPIIGILQTKCAPSTSGTPKNGKVECRPGIKIVATAGGVIVMGDRLKVDTAGKFAAASAQEVADGKSVALALSAAAADGDRFSMMLTGGAPVTTLVGSESIATSVATSVYTDETLVTLATADHVGALADGLFVGQRKKIYVIADSGGYKYTLTPTTMLAGQPTSFVFTATGQMIELTWTALGWRVTQVRTAGLGTTAAAGTINPLIRRQGLTIGSSGAEDRILPSGWVPGHTIKIAADSVGTGTSTISGLFNDEDGSADGIDANYNAAADECTFVWDGARWDPSSTISVTIST